MKNYLTLIAVLFIMPCTFAQEATGQEADVQEANVQEENKSEFKTLFGDRQISHGGYGAISVNYSQIDGKDGILLGGRGAWVIGHGIALGFSGTGFLNDFHYSDALRSNVNLAGGYGGLLVEPILFPKFPVHISVPLVAGVGGVAYSSSFNPYDLEDPHYFVEDATSFLVFEPGVELEFNIVRFFRLSIGAYYRMTTDIRFTDPDILADPPPTTVLEGFSGGITLKFGKF